MAALKAFLAVAAVAALIELTSAASLTVGSPGGSWDLKTNLSAWAQGQTFTQGDTLIFSYDSNTHDVLEVNKANYDSCGTSGPIATHTSGNDSIALSTVGKRYFICGKPTHCGLGMKMEVDTVAASTPGSSPSSPPSTPGTTPSPSSPPSNPGTTPSPPTSNPGTTPSPPTVTSPPPPGKSGASGRGLQAKAAIGFGLIMLLAL